MTTPFKLILFISMTIVLYGCPAADKHTKILPETKTVEIDLSVPHSDYGSTIFIGCKNDPISVIFRNHTDSAVRMYEDWNSWGYYNISFEITTKDSVYTVRKRPRGWWKNFPSYNVINPGESLVFNFTLDDSSCYEQRRIAKGSYQSWIGLPQKDYDSAKIKVLYELKEDIFLMFFDSSVVKDQALRRRFLTKMSSKQYDVSIAAAYQGYKPVIDLDSSGTKKNP